MGFLKAKCPQCWDSIPCGCPEQEDRNSNSINQGLIKSDKIIILLEEQNALLRKIANNKKRRNKKI